MHAKRRWFSPRKTIGCRYLAGTTWTQSKVNPAEDKEPPDEQAEERLTAQPRECYEEVDCPDHCCKAGRDSYDRSDNDDTSTHDGDCLEYGSHKQPDQHCKKASEPNETSPLKAEVITKGWTRVELTHTYHLDPEDDDKEFLCAEKVLQMPRGRWIQQVVMTRNGCAYSRTDNVAIALHEELKSANESAILRLYNEMSVDPWTVFWATRKQDSQ
eukprot:6650418-Pyramimonas_sp.AAC.1